MALLSHATCADHQLFLPLCSSLSSTQYSTSDLLQPSLHSSKSLPYNKQHAQESCSAYPAPSSLPLLMAESFLFATIHPIAFPHRQSPLIRSPATDLPGSNSHSPKLRSQLPKRWYMVAALAEANGALQYKIRQLLK